MYPDDQKTPSVPTLMSCLTAFLLSTSLVMTPGSTPSLLPPKGKSGMWSSGSEDERQTVVKQRLYLTLQLYEIGLYNSWLMNIQ